MWLCLQESDGSPSESGAVVHTASSGRFMSERQAAVELFFRLNHARQTVDFVKRQARPGRALFSQPSSATFTNALATLCVFKGDTRQPMTKPTPVCGGT